MKHCLCLFALLSFFAFAGEDDVAAKHAPVNEKDGPIEFGGWKDCFAFHTQPNRINALVVPQIGARVIRYAINADNILFDPADVRGKTLEKNPEGFWAGGYQLDVGPEIRGIPAHKELWMGNAWPTLDRAGVGPLVARSAKDETLGVRLTKRFSMDADTGVLHIGQEIENVADKVQNYCLWDRTLCEGGGYSLIKLNPKSRFKAGWCLGVNYNKGIWTYNGDNPEAENIKLMDGVLVTHCTGKSGKLGTDSDAGWIAYARGKLLFIKQCPVNAAANYTDAGITIANYWSDRVAELEPISPEVALKPGESFSFDETWTLIALDVGIFNFESARALVPKIEAALKK